MPSRVPLAVAKEAAVTACPKASAGLTWPGDWTLISDQNVTEMLEIVERAYVIDDGRMIFDGDPDAMTHDPQVIAHYLGTHD